MSALLSPVQLQISLQDVVRGKLGCRLHRVYRRGVASCSGSERLKVMSEEALSDGLSIAGIEAEGIIKVSSSSSIVSVWLGVSSMSRRMSSRSSKSLISIKSTGAVGEAGGVGAQQTMI